MKLLIAPWGNPLGWNEVKYRFGEVESVSRTSLKVLLAALNPEYTVILVADSLLDKASLRKNTNYASAKTAVRHKIFNFLKDGHIPLDKTKLDIWVLPGRGCFKNGVFEGEVLDYYYRLLYELAGLFNESDFKEVHLDLTHGLNFMPVLTYRAVKEILKVVSFFVPIKFVAYNADPFVREARMELLTLHVVEQEILQPTFPSLHPYEIDENARFFNSPIIDSDQNSLYRVNKNWVKNLLTFLGGAFYGLPLVLSTFFLAPQEIEKHLKDSLREYEKNVELNLNDNIHLRHRGSFTPFFRVLVLSWLFSHLLEKRNLLKRPQKEISLETIAKMVKDLFSRHLIFENILKNELHNLKKISPSNEWKLLNEIWGGTSSESIDRRNFFAHGGFERNAVLVRRGPEGTEFKYRKEILATLQKFVIKALRGV